MWFLNAHQIAQFVQWWNSGAHGPISNFFSHVGHGTGHIFCSGKQLRYDEIKGIVSTGKEVCK